MTATKVFAVEKSCKNILENRAFCEFKDIPDDCPVLPKPNLPVVNTDSCYCDLVSLEGKCKEMDILFTSDKYEDCGNCKACNKLAVKCEEGTPLYKFNDCGICPKCTADDVATEWSMFLECSANCGDAIHTKTRQRKSNLELSKMSCLVGDILTYEKLEITESCDLNCCGYLETFSEWSPKTFGDKDCIYQRESTVSCDEEPDKINVILKTELCPSSPANKLCVGTSGVCHTLENGNVECLVDETTKCCKVDVDNFPWQECDKNSACAYAEQKKFIDACAITLVQINENLCLTGNPACECEYAIDKTEYNCQSIADSMCIPTKTRNEGMKVTEVCILKAHFLNFTTKKCHQHEETETCTVKICNHDRQSCCEETECTIANGSSCSQTKRKCYDNGGDLMPSTVLDQDCCSKIDKCSSEDAEKLCPACDNTFPACLQDPDEQICTDGTTTCKNDPTDCECGNFECDYDSFRIEDITNQSLEKVQFEVPDNLYGPKIRFFIGPDMYQPFYDDPNCYDQFDITNTAEKLTIDYTYDKALACGAVETTAINTNGISEHMISVHVWVEDESPTSPVLTKGFKFAKVACVLPSASTAEKVLKVNPRFLPLEFREVVNPGSVDVNFDLATDVNFENLLEESDNDQMANALVIGEHIYAKITAKEAISVVNCKVTSLENNMSEMMIEDGCINPIMVENFQMMQLASNNDNTVIFRWQNFYFRQLSINRQRVSYSCQVVHCSVQPCQASCPKAGRKRRSIKSLSMKDEPTEYAKSIKNSSMEEDGELYFWLDVFKTTGDLQKARKELEVWEQSRGIRILMSYLAMVSSALVVAGIFVISIWYLKSLLDPKTRTFRVFNREVRFGGPKIFRKPSPKIDESSYVNNNLEVPPTFENPAFTC